MVLLSVSVLAVAMIVVMVLVVLVWSGVGGVGTHVPAAAVLAVL